MLRDLVPVLALVSLPSARGTHPHGFGVVHPPAAPDGIPAPERSVNAPGPGTAAADPAMPSFAASYSQPCIRPLERQLHNGLLIVNHVDHDPTGGILDYAGGTHAYDGHTGTDNAL